MNQLYINKLSQFHPSYNIRVTSPGHFEEFNNFTSIKVLPYIFPAVTISILLLEKGNNYESLLCIG